MIRRILQWLAQFLQFRKDAAEQSAKEVKYHGPNDKVNDAIASDIERQLREAKRARGTVSNNSDKTR